MLKNITKRTPTSTTLGPLPRLYGSYPLNDCLDLHILLLLGAGVHIRSYYVLFIVLFSCLSHYYTTLLIFSLDFLGKIALHLLLCSVTQLRHATAHCFYFSFLLALFSFYLLLWLKFWLTLCRIKCHNYVLEKLVLPALNIWTHELFIIWVTFILGLVAVLFDMVGFLPHWLGSLF